jgi:hypothetical protein
MEVRVVSGNARDPDDYISLRLAVNRRVVTASRRTRDRRDTFTLNSAISPVSERFLEEIDKVGVRHITRNDNDGTVNPKRLGVRCAQLRRSDRFNGREIALRSKTIWMAQREATVPKIAMRN